MIDTKELRIGNWVVFHDRPQKVTNVLRTYISTNQNEIIGNKHVDAIPLTQAALNQVNKELDSSHYFDRSGCLIIQYLGYDLPMPHIVFIHQLQNLLSDLDEKQIEITNV